MIRCQLPIINKLGLHARAATKLAAAAGHYACTVRTGKTEPLVDAKSIMSLMLLRFMDIDVCMHRSATTVSVRLARNF